MITTYRTANLPVTPISNKRYTIVSTDEKALWNLYIQNSKAYDFYHTWDYHVLEKSGSPFLFIYHHNDCYIAFPLVKRSIPKTAFFDCTSVYGYPGPVCNAPFENLDEEILEGFKDAFINFLNEENIVSVFSRLHPFFNQQLLFNKFNGGFNYGKTIAIDLKITNEERQAKYRRSIRQKINQLRTKGFIVKEASTLEEIAEFSHTYTENMIRVKASDNYFFDEKYFSSFLNARDYESKLLLVYFDNKIIAGGIITFYNKIMQFHLAATNNDFLLFAPIKLLFDEACIIGKNLGMEYLHLGGGLGGAEDSLYQFKSGFSDINLTFNTWQYISDSSVYDALVKASNSLNPNNKFPLYRF